MTTENKLFTELLGNDFIQKKLKETVYNYYGEHEQYIEFDEKVYHDGTDYSFMFNAFGLDLPDDIDFDFRFNGCDEEIQEYIDNVGRDTMLQYIKEFTDDTIEKCNKYLSGYCNFNVNLEENNMQLVSMFWDYFGYDYLEFKNFETHYDLAKEFEWELG